VLAMTNEDARIITLAIARKHQRSRRALTLHVGNTIPDEG